MACKCFDNAIAKIKERTIENLKERGVNYDKESLVVDFENRVFFFSSHPDTCPVTLKVKSSYNRLKNDNTPYKNMTHQEQSLVMTFCPMCGQKFVEDDK